jgi:multidrug efflux pump subunit AcrB
LGDCLQALIDIPVSLIATFFIMWLFGFSINVLTLLAIVLATGLVVDDGIVVTENIYKSGSGMSLLRRRKGSNEYFLVLFISITLAAVFLPVIFLEGFVGDYSENLESSSVRCIDFRFCIAWHVNPYVECLSDEGRQ